MTFSENTDANPEQGFVLKSPFPSEPIACVKINGQIWQDFTGHEIYFDQIPQEIAVTFRNLALNHPVACSPIEDPYICTNAVDGDLTTRWSSQFTDSQWIYVDLGTPKAIERVILHWEDAYASGYRIDVSNDAVNWTTIYSTNVGDGGIDNLDVSALGRYVRMYGTQRSTPWGYSLWELRVYGPALAVDKQAIPNPVQAGSQLTYIDFSG